MRPHRVGPCVDWPRKATAASRSTDWRALVISPSSLRRSRPRLPLHRPCDQATDQGASQARSRICPISTSRRHSANVCMDGGLTTRVDDAVKSSGSTTWRRETDSRVTRGLRQESTSAPCDGGCRTPDSNYGASDTDNRAMCRTMRATRNVSNPAPSTSAASHPGVPPGCSCRRKTPSSMP
jgi:hypothetical protein